MAHCHEVEQPAHPEGPFRADLRKFYRICFGCESPTLRQRLRLWATHFGLHCVAIYRYAAFARRVAARWHLLGYPLALAAGALEHLMELVHHVRIYARVGPGFYIGHVGMIFLGPTTIGRNFSVTHNVTVGLGHTKGAEGYPTIGDDVWIGTGSVISGAIQVGDGATIANGTMLSRTIPPRSLAAGNPGRIVQLDYDNAALLGMRPASRPALRPAPAPVPEPSEVPVAAESAVPVPAPQLAGGAGQAG